MISLNSISVRNRTIFIFFCLVGLLSYLNSFNAPFHYDDLYYLKENIRIESFKEFWNWFSEDYSRIFTGRPLLLFTFFLNYKFGGIDTFGYHLLNLLIHISNAFLLYLLLFRYGEAESPFNSPLAKGGDRGVGYSLKYAIAAVLFLIHPINTESVTYISSRSSVLSAFFVLASIICFFRATENKFHLGSYTLSVVFFILGLSTKEAAIVLPALLMLFDYFFISKNSRNLLLRIKYYLPYLVLISALSVLYMHYITTPSEGSWRPWPVHIFTEIKVFAEYLRLLVIPIGLNIDHDVGISNSIDSNVVVSFLVFLSLFMTAILFRKSKRIIAFSIFWFFINLVPFLVVRLDDFMAERWIYLASIGVSIALSDILVAKRLRKLGLVTAAAVVVLFGVLTVLRNYTYTSPVLLWGDAVKKSPYKYRPHLNLSHAYRENGNSAKAIEHTNEAIKVARKRGELVVAHVNLSAIYEDMREYKKAVEALKSVEKYTSNYYLYHHNMGSLYMSMGKFEEALVSFKKALKMRPDSIVVLFAIGSCYENLSESEEAKEYFMLAVKSTPRNSQEYISQGMSFLKLGNDRKAFEWFFEAVRLEPLDINARLNLAKALFESGHFDIAFKQYSIASEISPQYSPAYTGMGKTMLATGNLREARKHFNKALSLLPPGSSERKELLELLDKTKG